MLANRCVLKKYFFVWDFFMKFWDFLLKLSLFSGLRRVEGGVKMGAVAHFTPSISGWAPSNTATMYSDVPLIHIFQLNQIHVVKVYVVTLVLVCVSVAPEHGGRPLVPLLRGSVPMSSRDLRPQLLETGAWGAALQPVRTHGHPGHVSTSTVTVTHQRIPKVTFSRYKMLSIEERKRIYRCLYQSQQELVILKERLR